MKAHSFSLFVGLFAVALTQACGDYGSGEVMAPDPTPTPKTIVALSGDVIARVPEFGLAIGDVNNRNEPGLHPAGRREINWDGVPAQFTNNDSFPADFFNQTAPRGAVYSVNNGTGLRVSDNTFTDVNATYGSEFATFSTPRLFAPIGTTKSELRFRIPGTDTAAAVRSFGAVFVDVDKANTSRLQAYDKDNRLIADVAVPARAAPDAFSLVGVTFEQPVIARIVLTLGEAPIGAGINDLTSGGLVDVVVLDDFLYSEPQPLQ
jgi:hypothetical protein